MPKAEDFKKLIDFTVLQNAIGFLVEQMMDAGFGHGVNDPRHPMQRIKQLEQWRGSLDEKNISGKLLRA